MLPRVLALSAVFALVGLSLTCASRGWARDYAGTLTSLNRDDLVATVVIDDRTGLPLPGVSVRLYEEQELFEAPFVTEFRTDGTGRSMFRPPRSLRRRAHRLEFEEALT